jgi:hypothetical protein
MQNVANIMIIDDELFGIHHQVWFLICLQSATKNRYTADA